jgi:cytochrome P450
MRSAVPTRSARPAGPAGPTGAPARKRGGAADLRAASPEVLWEEQVQRAAHPLAYPALRSVRNRPVVRVPLIGVVVSDAAIAREVLLDLDHFSKVGPGAPSDLWTPVLGPSVLLNMEGAEHAALRRTLGPLFSPRAVRQLVSADRVGVLPDLTRRLAAG